MVGRPLTTHDLLPFVRHLQKTASNRKIDHALNIGVCVSGGPDSMALAYLLRQSQKEYGMNVRAWIVDHKARAESSLEANVVQENLKAIGIASTILSMQWPEGIDPLQLSDFESQARTKRYDLLARAAREHMYHTLLLGHHQDDQVETVLMRLIRNQNLSLNGLAGMAARSSVPGAWDVFGIHTASHPLSMPAYFALPSPLSGQSEQTSTKRQVLRNFKLMASGGVFIARPFLDRPKVDLVATCEANNVPYVIDPTNKDPRTSLRNAVRYLRTQHKLPRALSTSRILDLQQNAQSHKDQVKAQGDAILSTFHISKLDIRSGCAQVTFPHAKAQSALDAKGYAYAISKLTEMITPNNRVSHSSQIPSHLLRYLSNSNSPMAARDATRSPNSSFTFDKVQFVALPNQPNSWMLGRQPMRSTEIAENTKNFSASSEVSLDDNNQSEWLLWDNRFWIRVRAVDIQTVEEVGIRPLRQDDMPKIHEHIKHIRNEKGLPGLDINKVLHNAAPMKFRYTLPVLTFQGRIVALPTLHYNFATALAEPRLSSMTWEVSYNAFSLLHKFPEVIAKYPAESEQEHDLKIVEKSGTTQGPIST